MRPNFAQLENYFNTSSKMLHILKVFISTATIAVPRLPTLVLFFFLNPPKKLEIDYLSENEHEADSTQSIFY